MPGLVANSGADIDRAPAYVSVQPDSYVLRPADVIRIDVFREEGLTIESIPVAANGTVSVPLIGQIVAAGKTPQQLSAEVAQRLGESYLLHPAVSVNVLDYASHLVTVEGAVETAGVYKFAPGTRLTGAVALASGISREAKRSDVAIFREVADGVEVAKFDLAAVNAGAMADPVLKPGDRVVVGWDGLSIFWQDALRAIPAFALFARF